MLPELDGATRPQLTANAMARPIAICCDLYELLTQPQVIDFGFSFSLFYAVKNGLGLHAKNIPPENEDALNKANYAFTVLYVSLFPGYLLSHTD